MATTMTTDCCVVMITTPDAALAKRIADMLIDKRLGACVQVTNVDSTYRWSSEVHRTPEVLMLVKTRTALLGELVDQVREMHVYDAPEIVALPIIGGAADYLHWVDSETRPIYR